MNIFLLPSNHTRLTLHWTPGESTAGRGPTLRTSATAASMLTVSSRARWGKLSCRAWSMRPPSICRKNTLETLTHSFTSTWQWLSRYSRRISFHGTGNQGKKRTLWHASHWKPQDNEEIRESDTRDSLNISHFTLFPMTYSSLPFNSYINRYTTIYLRRLTIL